MDAREAAAGAGAAPCAAPAGPKPLAAPSGVHVLVVDDENMSRTIVSSLLRKCGYAGEPFAARNSRIAPRARPRAPAHPAAPPAPQSRPPAAAPRRWTSSGAARTAPLASSSA